MKRESETKGSVGDVRFGGKRLRAQVVGGRGQTQGSFGGMSSDGGAKMTGPPDPRPLQSEYEVLAPNQASARAFGGSE
jgi:hypothetical protein